jgi:hypothetical protein
MTLPAFSPEEHGSVEGRLNVPRTFSPTDRGRRSRATAGSRDDFDQTLKDIMALVGRLWREDLYGAVHGLGYSNMRSTHPRDIEAGRGSLTDDGHADPSGDFAVAAQSERYRSVADSAARRTSDLLKDLRGVERSLREALGDRAIRSGPRARYDRRER